MPNVCCLPGCSDRQPQHHLFKVPSKKFLQPNSKKFIWAESLEKIIKSYRGDPYICTLDEKDKVKFCEVHFKDNDEILQSKLRPW